MDAAPKVVMGIVRPDALQAMTGGESPALLLLSLPALAVLFMPIAVFNGAKFLFLPCRAGKFLQFSGQLHAIPLPSRKSKLLFYPPGVCRRVLIIDVCDPIMSHI
jgi:hypothetical protein